MHKEPTLKDRNAIDAPLPDGHPLKREPLRRPMGAGSEVRRAERAMTETERRKYWAAMDVEEFAPPYGSVKHDFGITNENAPRVLRAIYSDDDEDSGERPGNPGVTPLGAALIVGACTIGACVLLVALAYVAMGW